MSFDSSRFLFDPLHDYLGVVMQQGRVQLDADWNEWLAQLSRRLQAGTLDLVGRSGVPATTPAAFRVTALFDGTNPPQIAIGAGRIYVDGLLAENHGSPTTPLLWDPALAELSASPALPNLIPSAVDYTLQPYLPGAALTPAQVAGKQFLVFLDVWQRDVTALQDPTLIDPALGVDTTARRQTVWQVKLLDVTGQAVTSATLDAQLTSPPSADFTFKPWPTLLQGSGALLTTGTGGIQTAAASACALSPATGYTGLENQLYRVEIHQIVPPTATTALAATFKWSRENASVSTLVSAIATLATNGVSQLTVQSLGRDQVLGFNPGDWIELTDDVLELSGQAGELHRIASIDPYSRTLTLDSAVSTANFPLTSGQTDPTRHTRILRWDQAGAVYVSDGTALWIDLDASGANGIPVPPTGTSLVLESGITVAFDLSTSGGFFQPGDFWTFAARTADSSVQTLIKAPPQGPLHHFARLATVDFTARPFPAVVDCRRAIPTLANPAIHVVNVLVGANPLANDNTITVQSLIANGIGIVCDAPLDPAIVTHPNLFPRGPIALAGAVPSTQPNNPICTVSLDLPSAPNGGAFTRVTLPCVVTVNAATLQWKPAISSAGNPSSLSLLEAQIPLAGPAVLARLSLKGSAIWAAGNPAVLLNGANNGRPSADFDLWFWLISQPVTTISLNALSFRPQNLTIPSDPQTFTVTNNDTKPLTINGIAIAPPFSQTNDIPIPTPGQLPALPPGATGTFKVVFDPTTVGDFKSQILITESDTNTSPLTVTLFGTGVQPSLIAAANGGLVYPPATNPIVFPSNTIVNATTPPQNIRLTSNGTSQVTVNKIEVIPLPGQSSLTNEFVLSNLPNNGNPFSLQPGDIADIQVAFHPFFALTYNVQLSISHSGPTSPILIPLSAAAINGTATLSPASPITIDFGSVTLGVVTSRDVVLQNTGNIPIAINAITKLPASPSAADVFSITANPPTLQPGPAITITSVIFFPTAIGEVDATLQIACAASNAAPTTFIVNLKGVGRKPAKTSSATDDTSKIIRDNQNKIIQDNGQKAGTRRLEQIVDKPVLQVVRGTLPLERVEAAHQPFIAEDERPILGPTPPKPE